MNTKKLLAILALIILACPANAEDFDPTSWYSQLKDSHNSRIVDDILVPPFKTKWIDTLPYNEYPSFLARNGKLLALIRNGYYKAANDYFIRIAYDLSTGERLWTQRAVTGLDTGPSVLIKEYVMGTDSHYQTGGMETETGLGSTAGNINYSLTTVDDSGSIVTSEGWCCIDCMSYCLMVDDFSNSVGPQPVSGGKFDRAYKFERILGRTGGYDSAFEYIDFGERATPRDRIDLREELTAGNRDWTVMLWFKGDGKTISKKAVLFVKGRKGAYDYPIGSYGATIDKSGYVNVGIGYENSTGYHGGNSFQCLPDEWCHLTMTYDHEKLSMYKNGQLVFFKVAYRNANSNNVDNMKDDLLSRTSDPELISYIESIETYTEGGRLKGTQEYLDDLVFLSNNMTNEFKTKLSNLLSHLPGKDIRDTTESFYAGGLPESRTRGFTGLIDELAIFDRALTETEIQNRFDEEIIPDEDTVLLLHFNNNSNFGENENFIHDFSGNDFHGIPIHKHYQKRLWVTSAFGIGTCRHCTPAFHEGIMYRSDGILHAINPINRDVYWQQGVLKNQISLGNINHDCGEIIYSDGMVYTTAREAVNYSIYDSDKKLVRNEIAFEKPVLVEYNANTGERITKIDLNTDDAGINYNTIEDPGHIVIDDGIAFIYFYKNPNHDYPFKLSAVDTLTGEILWNHDLLPDEKNAFCEQTFVISGNLLFASINGKIVAFNKNTGEIVWQFKNPYIPDFYTKEKDNCFSGLIIEDNVLFLGHRGKVFALESGFSEPEILNKETELDAGQVGLEYKETYDYRGSDSLRNMVFKTTNGKWPYDWKIVNSSSPPGLTLENEEDDYFGILKGTPTEAGYFTFTVEVTDTLGKTDEKEFNIRIMPEAKTFSITLQNGLEGYEGCSDSYMNGKSSGQNNNYGNLDELLLSVGYLQRSLIRFDIFESEGGPVPDDAVITGMGLDLYKTDNLTRTIFGYQALKNWSESEVTWNNATSNDPWEIPGAGAIGIDKSEKKSTLVTQPSSGFQNFDITPLAEDLKLENRGWVFEREKYDVPTVFLSCDYAANQNFRPKLQVDYKRFNPENEAPITKIYTNPTTVLVGETFAMDGSGSHDPDGEIIEYEWSETCNDFDPKEPWLCNITYSTQGIRTMTLTTYDDYGYYTSESIQLKVVSSIDSTTITTDRLKEGQIHKQYSDFVYAQGGQNYTWSIINENLPPGLNLNSGTGQITGTPTTAGTYDFTIQVNENTKALQIVIKNDSGEYVCGMTNASCGGTYPNCQNCNQKDTCQGNTLTDYYCNNGTCSVKPPKDCSNCDCQCGGYNTDESLNNNNCTDQKDNDCDGLQDQQDPNCKMNLTDYISHWKFNGNTLDETGKNHGNPQGGAIFEEDTERGQVLSLDGTGDYVKINNDESLNLEKITISAWVNAKTIVISGSSCEENQFPISKNPVYSKSSGGLYNSSLLKLCGTEGVRFGIGTTSASNPTTGIQENEWYHIASTYDKEKIKIYVDGELVRSKYYYSGIPTSDYDVWIGGSLYEFRGTPFYSYFNGLVDDVMVFDRPLTQEEITALYCDQGGTGEACGQQECNTKADTPPDGNCDNCVDITEMTRHIAKFYQGTAQLNEIIASITAWRTGC